MFKSATILKGLKSLSMSVGKILGFQVARDVAKKVSNSTTYRMYNPRMGRLLERVDQLISLSVTRGLLPEEEAELLDTERLLRQLHREMVDLSNNPKSLLERLRDNC